MADAVVPRWHGDNYQARVFWENAVNLLHPASCVVEVSFEANGPKAFDDVVVRYDPPVARSGPVRVPADYHQVKWHVEYGGRFGFEDLIEPAFIGAKLHSILERLQQAKATAPAGSCFSFITTYRIKDNDPLAVLISGTDKSLLVEKLFDGTKTDKSRMGGVRKLWREHLKLGTDEELRTVVTGLRIFEGYLSLDELRASINFRAQVVGLLTCSNATSDFRYDELARQLKVRNLNALTRQTLEQICRDEGLLVALPTEQDNFLKVAIRTCLGPAADVVGALPENTLLLTDSFRQRYLRDDLDWKEDIRPRVTGFLRAAVVKSPRLRLFLDAHASIAFLAGSILDLKSAVEIELVQKGRVGSRTWRADDNSAARGGRFEVTTHAIGSGEEIAVAISVSQDAEPQALAYVQAKLPDVGSLVHLSIPGGVGGQTVVGGEHATVLAEQVSNAIRGIKVSDPDATVHIFAACPNTLLFFLGQHHQGIAPCIVYEFDFDRKSTKTYQPSFVID